MTLILEGELAQFNENLVCELLEKAIGVRILRTPTEETLYDQSETKNDVPLNDKSTLLDFFDLPSIARDKRIALPKAIARHIKEEFDVETKSLRILDVLRLIEARRSSKVH